MTEWQRLWMSAMGSLADGQALDHWSMVIRKVAKDVTAADLLAMHAGIL